jgi:hypothetical protein
VNIDHSEIVLRATSEHLWVARSGAYPAGTIEQGRRYTALDLNGDVVARCTSLQGASEALSSGGARCAGRSEAGARMARRGASVGAIGAPVVMLGALLALFIR